MRVMSGGDLVMGLVMGRSVKVVSGEGLLMEVLMGHGCVTDEVFWWGGHIR